MTTPRARLEEYGAVSALSAVVALLVLRPWTGGWSTPLVWGNDTRSALAMVESAGWTGTARGTASLGAPYASEWIDFPLGPDRLHLVMFRLLRGLVDDRVSALNLLLLGGFVVVALAAFGVLRQLGIGQALATSLAIVFSLAPYHFERLAVGNLFLAAYFAVPLAVLLALWAADGSLARPDLSEPPGSPGQSGPSGQSGSSVSSGLSEPADNTSFRRRWMWALLWVLVIGSSSAYYAAYGIVMILGLGLWSAIRDRSMRVLAVPLVLASGTALVVALNVIGDLVAARVAGVNLEASGRAEGDLARYALDLLSMVAPDPGHRISWLGSLGSALRGGGEFEGGAYLGVIALTGLVALGVGCAFARSAEDGQDDRSVDAEAASRLAMHRRLAALVVAACATGSFLAPHLLVAVGFVQIRAWDRISVVVMFLGLCGLGSMVQQRLDRGARGLTATLIGVALVGLAVIDQSGSMPRRSDAAAEHRIDSEVARSIMEKVGDDSMVFQFPYVAFPGDVTDRGMPPYAHLGPWAASPGMIRFSAGGMQGRAGDWQSTWAAQDPLQMARGLAAADFDVLYIDRRADPSPYAQRQPLSGTDFAVSLERAGLHGVPSSDGTREWFDLRQLRARLIDELGVSTVNQIGHGVVRPIGITFTGASPYSTAEAGMRLLEPRSSMTLRSEQPPDGNGGDAVVGPVDVSFKLIGEPGESVLVRVAGSTRRIHLEDGTNAVRLRLAMDEPSTTIRIEALGRSGTDAEVPPLRLTNIEVLDPAIALLDPTGAASDSTGHR